MSLLSFPGAAGRGVPLKGPALYGVSHEIMYMYVHACVLRVYCVCIVCALRVHRVCIVFALCMFSLSLSLNGSWQDALYSVHKLYYGFIYFKTSTSSLETTASNGLTRGKSVL